MNIHEELQPSAWVRRFCALIRRGGRVLDIASGRGRHARLLRDLGCTVVAVDRDEASLEGMRSEPGIQIVCADLESGPWPFQPRSFDAVVVTNYLYRPLFAPLKEALKEGGVLIYETFAVGNERYGRPSNPEFLLRRDELLGLAAPLQVVAFEQGHVSAPRPAVLQRICAVRAEEPVTLEAGISVACSDAFGLK